jgi:ABC-2 type transport system permease protein
MLSPGRYLRLYGAFARYGLSREMAFRGNFLAKISVEVLWIFLMLVFYKTVFRQSSQVAGWNEAEYLFFVGCYVTLEGFLETLFLENCLGFADLVRTGDLDFYLLKPIDEQFLISCKSVDYSTAPNILIGIVLIVVSLHDLDWAFDALRLAVFVVNFLAGLALAYSCLLMLSATSLWLKRNSSMMEMWWLFTTLMRYPRDIFSTPWALPIGFFFSFLLPVMLVIHVPATSMVKALEPWMCLYLAGAAAAMLFLSRKFLHLALRHYRSASS